VVCDCRRNEYSVAAGSARGRGASQPTSNTGMGSFGSNTGMGSFGDTGSTTGMGSFGGAKPAAGASSGGYVSVFLYNGITVFAGLLWAVLHH